MRNIHISGRSNVLGTNGMAATSQPLSSLEAISILKKGSKNNFLDNCCHLSKKGADIVSFHLSTILINL